VFEGGLKRMVTVASIDGHVNQCHIVWCLNILLLLSSFQCPMPVFDPQSLGNCSRDWFTHSNCALILLPPVLSGTPKDVRPTANVEIAQELTSGIFF